MLAADLPDRFPIPFADAAGPSYIRPIPEASQIGIEDGAASLTDGFPPDTFTPVTAGGVPPFGQDFNGLLNQITAWNRWQAMGGPVKYDGTFQTAIGGYPQGAVIMSASTVGLFWLSLVDNNTSNPDTGGANWRGFAPGFSSAYGVVGGTANAMTLTLTPGVPAYSTGLTFEARTTLANTSTAVTLNLNGLGAKAIKLQDNSDPAVGQIVAGAVLQLTYDGVNLIWKNAPPLLNGSGAATAGGTANALTATVSPLQAYTSGLLLRIAATAANTTAPTININGLGAKSILWPDGSALSGGEIEAGLILLLYYNGTNFLWANAPWATTAPVGTASKRLATTAFVQAAVAASSSSFLYHAATSATPVPPMTFNYVDTRGGAVTLPLPASPTTGMALTFADIGKSWGFAAFTLGRNGQTIQGIAEDLVCAKTNLQFSIGFDGTTWVLF